ncbi:MAG: hypothetical protein D6758_12370 [Gammaproteobacteria bacterium]|nr:MAG: hypothetical protein D6758_12370 [Gammaproteobacteria bacterium]
MALLAALKRPALLVGAMASERTAGKRRSRLAQLGLSPFEISRLESPLGLPVGSRLPFEIALSILGRILQLKNARQAGQASKPFPQGLKQARM